MRDCIGMMAIGLLLVCTGIAPGNPCVVPDNGSGTVTLPPQGCEYLSPGQVHKILDGLPPGTTIELAPIHKNFLCYHQEPGSVCTVVLPPGTCEIPGGTLGGQLDCFESHLEMQLTGTGSLAGWTRIVNVPVSCEVHTGPRNPGAAVQTFSNKMFRLDGQLTGDPDFDLLRITGGTDYGLPSSGQTTLTQHPGGMWGAYSFFNITYRIEFVGSPNGPLAGMSGSTTGPIQVLAGEPEPPPYNYTLGSSVTWKPHGVPPFATYFYIPLPLASSGSTSPGVETRVGGITQLEFRFTGFPTPLPTGSTGYLRRSDGVIYNPTSAVINGLNLTLNFSGIPNAYRYVCCLNVAGLTGDRDVEVIGQVGNIAQAPPPTLWKTDATDLGAIGPFIGQTTTQANCQYDITQSPPTSRMKIDSSDKTTLAGSYSGPVQTTPVTCP